MMRRLLLLVCGLLGAAAQRKPRYIPKLAQWSIAGSLDDARCEDPLPVDSYEDVVKQHLNATAFKSYVVDWMVAGLTGVAQNKVGPTRAARSLFILSSAQYDAYQAIIGKLKAWDGQEEWKCTEFLDGDSLTQVAWMEAADNFIYSSWFDRNNWNRVVLNHVIDHHKKVFRKQFAARLKYIRRSTCFREWKIRATGYLNRRDQDGSKHAGRMNTGPAILNINERINCHNNSAAAKQDLRRLPAPDHWTPVTFLSDGKPVNQTYLTPAWGEVLGVLSAEDTESLIQFGLKRYPTKKEYEADLDEIVAIHKTLSDKHKVQAEYWSAPPGSVFPPGQWSVMTVWLIQALKLKLRDQVIFMWMMNQSLFQSSIVTWKLKRLTIQKRPVQGIRQRYRGTRIRDYRGPVQGEAWMPYQDLNFVSPPFPDYPSGHSCFSASAVSIIRHLLGTDIVPRARMDSTLLYLISPQVYRGVQPSFFLGDGVMPKGSSTIQPGKVPRKDYVMRWPTFSEMALSAGESRIGGGIHGQYANVASLEIGDMIGNLVFARCRAVLDNEATVIHTPQTQSYAKLARARTAVA